MKIHGTAKGAALSTKDFGVAFGGAAPGVILTNPIASENSSYGISAAGLNVYEVAYTDSSQLIGKNFKDVQLYFKITAGSPTGTITVSHVASDDSTITTFWAWSITGLTSSYQAIGNGLFTGSDTDWVEGDKLKVTTDATSLVRLALTQTDDPPEPTNWDGVESVSTYGTGQIDLTKDFCFILDET